MGRASRRKREAREAPAPRAPPGPAPAIGYINNFDADYIYRFVDRPEFADDFTAGRIFLSTLEACRKTEDAARGDAGEGIHTYESGVVRGDMGDPFVRHVAERSGILLPPFASGSIEIVNQQGSWRAPDAFILCTTASFEPERMEDLGPYCVRIARPRWFLHRVTAALRHKYRVLKADIGLVTYRERHYRGLDDSPGVQGFVKPPDKYAHEREVRLMWRVHSSHYPLSRFVLDCPAVRSLCVRVL